MTATRRVLRYLKATADLCGEQGHYANFFREAHVNREGDNGAEDWNGRDRGRWWHSEGLVIILIHLSHEPGLSSLV